MVGKTRRLAHEVELKDHLRQGLNFIAQGGMPTGSINSIFGRPDRYKPGQVRMNTNNQRFVSLMHWRFLSEEGQSIKIWYVEDLVTENRYDMRQRDLGREGNAMEVIAWAAK